VTDKTKKIENPAATFSKPLDVVKDGDLSDLTVFLYQRMGDYCIGMISSRW
jgi:hypothetical protein